MGREKGRHPRLRDGNDGVNPEPGGTGHKRIQAMANVETGTVQMITALRDSLHGLHIARMALVAESKALRLAGRRAERDRVWARVAEITAQIEVSTKELAEHMLSAEFMPCPFCGGVAKHTFVMDDHWVSCTVCGVSGKIANTRQHAVDAWNTRTAYMPDDRRSGE